MATVYAVLFGGMDSDFNSEMLGTISRLSERSNFSASKKN